MNIAIQKENSEDSLGEDKKGKKEREQELKAAFEYIQEFCIEIRGEKSKAVHNMAFFFLSKINDPEKIISFLEREETKKSKGGPIYFEVDYALNICKQK